MSGEGGMELRAGGTAQQAGRAVLLTLLAPELNFRWRRQRPRPQGAVAGVTIADVDLIKPSPQRQRFSHSSRQGTYIETLGILNRPLSRAELLPPRVIRPSHYHMPLGRVTIVCAAPHERICVPTASCNMSAAQTPHKRFENGSPPS
jgi:hypothetical protein